MTGAILAGGRSSRMGTNKALLAFGGRTIIAGVLEGIRPLFDEVIVVANDREAYRDLGVPIVLDRVPDKGSLGGIYTAVVTARHSHAFCIACDMPFPNPALIARLRDLAPGYDVVVPRAGEGVHPLHAVYGKDCLPIMEEMMAANRLKIDGLYPRVRVRYVDEEEIRPFDPHLDCLLNVNTRDDLAAAAERLRGRT